MSVYKKGYRTNHTLISFIKNWRKTLDKSFNWSSSYGSSKAFDCIPYDILIAKLHVYGLGFDKVTFLFTYLKSENKKYQVIAFLVFWI